MAKPVNLDGLKHLNIDQAVIDKDAAAVLNSATKAVSKILARRRELDANGQRDKPLVVLAGESHVESATALHHLLLLKKLRPTEPSTIFTYEFAHDFDRGVANELKIDTSKFNPEEKSRWLLSIYLDFFSVTFARYAKKVLFNYVLQKDIPFRATDTSMRNHHLNGADPSTRDSLNACSPRWHSWLRTIFADRSGPSALEDKGLHARNHHIVKSSLAFGEETGARIIVQHCGYAHITGVNLHPYEQSLTALFNKSGHQVFTIYDNENADHDISALPRWRARYDEIAKNHKNMTDFLLESEETTYLDAVLAKLNMEQYSYTAEAKQKVNEGLTTLMNKPPNPAP